MFSGLFNTGLSGGNIYVPLIGGNSTETTLESPMKQPLPISCSISGFNVSTDTSPITPVIITLRENGANTAAFCSVGTSATSCSTSTSVSLTSGDLYDFDLSYTVTGGVNNYIHISAWCH